MNFKSQSTKLLVLTLTTILLLITPNSTFDCNKKRGCKSCNLHKEECELDSCHNKYYYAENKCNIANTIVGCKMYEFATTQKCKVCEKDYILSFDKMSCEKFGASSCGTDCITCQQSVSGVAVGADGTGSTCMLCDNLYVSKVADTINCYKKVTGDPTYRTFVKNCNNMIANTDECFFCEDKYSFDWNAGGSVWPGASGKVCGSNNGKQNFCWQFANAKGTGCETCYLGYIMVNEKTCVARSVWASFGFIAVLFVVVLTSLIWQFTEEIQFDS